MSITEIKDIKKLQSRLKSALDELKYIKKCCENAGVELAKHSFAYDHKEKNLVIQAMELNEKYEKFKKALDEIAKHYQKVMESITTYDDRHDANISIEALHNISDIITKTKEDK